MPADGQTRKGQLIHVPPARGTSLTFQLSIVVGYGFHHRRG
jgi:hypothetical protein